MSDAASDCGNGRRKNNHNRGRSRGGDSSNLPHREGINESNNPYTTLTDVSEDRNDLQQSAFTANISEPSAGINLATNDFPPLPTDQAYADYTKDEEIRKLKHDLRAANTQSATLQRQLEDLKRWLSRAPVDLAALVRPSTSDAFAEPTTTKTEAGAGSFYANKSENNNGDAFRHRTSNPQGLFFSGNTRVLPLDYNYRAAPLDRSSHGGCNEDENNRRGRAGGYRQRGGYGNRGEREDAAKPDHDCSLERGIRRGGRGGARGRGRKSRGRGYDGGREEGGYGGGVLYGNPDGGKYGSWGNAEHSAQTDSNWAKDKSGASGGGDAAAEKIGVWGN